MRINPRNSGIYEILRTEVGLVDVVSRYTELSDRGDTHIGFCPLTEQNSGNPAFKIYNSDSFYCFSCHEHGDVVAFWKLQHEHPDMYTAALDLARTYGVELPEFSEAARERYERRKARELSATEQADANHKALYTDKGERAREYLKGRGFPEDSWERFRFGVDPKGRPTIPFFSGPEIHGSVVRNWDGASPKYKAPKAEDFPLERKPLYMFSSPRTQEYALVEGYFDVPALEYMGIPAIGAAGSSFSSEQIEDLRALGERGAEFVVIPDGDESGLKGADRTARKLYPYARLASPLNGVKDAAELLQSVGVGGADQVRDVMHGAVDMLERAVGELDAISSPIKQTAHLHKVIVPLILQIEDEATRVTVIKHVAAHKAFNKDAVVKAIQKAEGVRILNEDKGTEEEIPRSEYEDLLEPGVLERYAKAACKRQGVVGEIDQRVVKLVTLCMVGAQLGTLPSGQPVGASMAILGPASRGKNFVCDGAVCLAPESWYKSFTLASAQAFYWAAKQDPTILQHKFLYPNEIEGVDAVVEFLRPMLSQGRAEKFVTNKDASGAFVFEAIYVEGPITGVIPTVRNKLEGQLQTRLLLADLPDYEGRVKEQTAARSRQSSRRRVLDVSDEDLRRWQAALQSLTETRSVVWAFAEHEGFHLDNGSLEHGARLWHNLLGLAQANAFLEQNNREIVELDDGTPAIEARAEDYAVAYGLLADTSKRSMVNLSDAHRKILDAAYELGQTFSGGWSMRKIAEKAGVSTSTVHSNKTFLTKSVGYIYPHEDGGLAIVQGADKSWWTEGEPMRGFPRPETVYGWEEPPPEDTHTPRGRKQPNSRTPDENPDRYAAKPVREEPNSSRTHRTRSAEENGSEEELPLSDYLAPGESATGDQLRRIRKLVQTGVLEEVACARVLGAGVEESWE
jgi:DNA primase